MTSFFEMGGYGAFVWPAYTAAILGVAIITWRSLQARARARRLVARLEVAAEDETS